MATPESDKGTTPLTIAEVMEAYDRRTTQTMALWTVYVVVAGGIFTVLTTTDPFSAWSVASIGMAIIYGAFVLMNLYAVFMATRYENALIAEFKELSKGSEFASPGFNRFAKSVSAPPLWVPTGMHVFFDVIGVVLILTAPWS